MTADRARCPATFEAVEELVVVGDTGCLLCGRLPEAHDREAPIPDDDVYWLCRIKGCVEKRREHYSTCETHKDAP